MTDRWPDFKDVADGGADVLSCPCGCGLQPNAQLMNLLQTMRTRIRKPLKVTSAARCKTYNASIGGAKNSAHLLGLAADIAADGELAYHIVWTAMLWGFRRIFLYDTHVHIDMASDKTHPTPRLGVG